MNYSFGNPTTTTGSLTFGTPTTAAPGTTSFTFGGGDAANKGLSIGKPAGGITFGTPGTGLLSGIGTSPAPVQTSELGFGFGTPSNTVSAPGFNLGTTGTTVSAAGTPIGGGFSVNATPQLPATGGFSFGGVKTTAVTGFSLTTTTASPSVPIASSVPTAFSVTSTAPTLSSDFSLTTPASTPLSSSGGFSLGAPVTAPLSLAVTTAPPTSAATFSLTGAVTSASAGLSFAPASTSTTTSVSLTSGTTVTTSATAPGAGSAAPGGASLNFCQLEESINKWTLELEEQEKVFMNQATQVNAWDRMLIENGDKIVTLNESVERVKQEQKALEHELDFIVSQQVELEEMIVPLEQELSEISVRDPEREHTYQLAENLDTQLKQMAEDLKEVIEHLNETNRTHDSNDPIVQIGRILNAHMSSLQWVDTSTAQINAKLQQVTQMQQSLRRDTERAFHRTFQ